MGRAFGQAFVSDRRNFKHDHEKVEFWPLFSPTGVWNQKDVTVCLCGVWMFTADEDFVRQHFSHNIPVGSDLVYWRNEQMRHALHTYLSSIDILTGLGAHSELVEHMAVIRGKKACLPDACSVSEELAAFYFGRGDPYTQYVRLCRDLRVGRIKCVLPEPGPLAWPMLYQQLLAGRFE